MTTPRGDIGPSATMRLSGLCAARHPDALCEITAAVTGRTLRQAAAELGVVERTFYRWLANWPALREAVELAAGPAHTEFSALRGLAPNSRT